MSDNCVLCGRPQGTSKLWCREHEEAFRHIPGPQEMSMGTQAGPVFGCGSIGCLFYVCAAIVAALLLLR